LRAIPIDGGASGKVMGIAHASACAPPILVWGWGSQEVGIATSSSSSRREREFLCSTEPFLRPDRDAAGAPRTAAVKAGRRCAGAACSALARPRLDGGEHGARLEGRDDWSRAERQDVILDWAVNVECESTASPCIRSGTRPRYPDLSCTGESKAQKRRDPSTTTVWVNPGWVTVTRLSWVTSAVIARGRSEARTQHGAGGHHAGRQITPQRHHELARHRHDGDAPDASLDVAHPLAEPAAQLALGLVPEP
jgi:hypothetical protein